MNDVEQSLDHLLPGLRNHLWLDGQCTRCEIPHDALIEDDPCPIVAATLDAFIAQTGITSSQNTMNLDEPLKIMMRPDEANELRHWVIQQPDDAMLVEFGCGGSTLFIAQLLKPTQELVSIEHNHDWCAKVSQAIFPQHENVSLVLCPPGMESVDRKFATPLEELPVGLVAYLNPPHIDWDRVTLVLVDGIARGAVLALLQRRTKPGTIVLVHDYAGRQAWYDWAMPGDVYQQIALVDSLLIMRRI